MLETRVRSLDREGPLEKEMATHSSILAWRIPWTEEPRMLQSMGMQKVRHDWANQMFFIAPCILKAAPKLALFNPKALIGQKSRKQAYYSFLFFFFFGCTGSSFLHTGFLKLQWTGSALCCGGQASHCGGFSCCQAQALGTQALVCAAQSLISCGLWALEYVGSRSCSLQAREHRLSSCGTLAWLPTACATFWDQGSNPCPLHWQADSYPPCHQGSLFLFILKNYSWESTGYLFSYSWEMTDSQEKIWFSNCFSRVNFCKVGWKVIPG